MGAAAWRAWAPPGVRPGGPLSQRGMRGRGAAGARSRRAHALASLLPARWTGSTSTPPVPGSVLGRRPPGVSLGPRPPGVPGPPELPGRPVLPVSGRPGAHARPWCGLWALSGHHSLSCRVQGPRSTGSPLRGVPPGSRSAWSAGAPPTPEPPRASRRLSVSGRILPHPEEGHPSLLEKRHRWERLSLDHLEDSP